MFFEIYGGCPIILHHLLSLLLSNQFNHYHHYQHLQSTQMPRCIQPSGKLGTIHVQQYIARRKLGLIAAVCHVMETGNDSLNQAAALKIVSRLLIAKWTKDELDVLCNMLVHLCSLRQLSTWCFASFSSGIPVNILMVVLEASSISLAFTGKSIKAQFLAAR